MTAKQWKIIDEEFISYTGGTAQLISNGECKIHLWENPKDAQLFCDKLNAINEENEQLKETNQELFDDLQNKTTWLSLRGGELAISKKENEQLKHRLAISEKAKYVTTLEKENEQLKSLIKALKKSNTDYVNQIKKAYDEKLSFGELANNCGVDLE